MSRFLFAVVLLFASPAFGARPATRPVPRTEVEKLRAEVEELKTEVEKLKADLADLQEKFSSLQLAPGQPAKIAPAAPAKRNEAEDAAKAGKVIVGQTKEQSRGVLNQHGWTTSISNTETMANGKRVRREVWIVNENNAFAFKYPNRITLENDVVVRVE